MKCNSCNQIIPEDSIFCPCCGKRCETKQATPILIRSDRSVAPSSQAVSSSTKPKSAHTGLAVVLAIGLIISICINFFFCFQAIPERQRQIDRISSELNLSKEEYDALNNKLNKITPKTTRYDSIVHELKKGGIGSSSRNFYCSDYIVYVRIGGAKQITLVTMLGYTTVTTYNSDKTVSSVTFNEQNWYGNSTELTVRGLSAGVSTITFTNNQNNDSFSVLVVVE